MRRAAGLLALLALLALTAAAPLPTLTWQGTARVFAGGRTVDIGVSTTVVPFVSARSDSWLLADGPAKTRLMIIEGGEGFVERDGARRPLPAATTEHERQQYALYGLMLTTHAKGRCVAATHDGAPPTELCFDRAGNLVSGSNSVPDPESGRPVAQRFAFDGRQVSNGVAWPRVIRIMQDGKPYFELTLTRFEARR